MLGLGLGLGLGLASGLANPNPNPNPTRLDPEGQGFRVNRPEGPTCEFAFRWDSPKRRAAAPTEAEPEEGEG